MSALATERLVRAHAEVERARHFEPVVGTEGKVLRYVKREQPLSRRAALNFCASRNAAELVNLVMRCERRERAALKHWDRADGNEIRAGAIDALCAADLGHPFLGVPMACLQDVHFTKGKRKGEVLNPFEQAKRAVNSARIRATDARTRDKRRLFRLPGNDRPVLDPAGEDPMHVAMREETLGSLTDVERSLLTLLQQGYSDREIARGSKVDEVQIAEYRRSIREKLAAAVARDDQALPAGYVPPGTRAAPKGSSNDAEHGGNAPGLARLLRGVLPAAAAELQEAREAD